MNRWKILLCSLLILACCALLVPSASAQYRAGVQGTVTDAQGAVVPGAQVTLTSKETNRTIQGTTNDSGVFTLLSLAPGIYTITAERAGFKKATIDNVQVLGEQMQSVNLQLAIGEVSETVTVTDVIPTIDTQTANITGNLTAKDIQTLPSFARDPFQLLRLAPGVFGAGALNGGGGSNSIPGTNIGAPSATESIFKTENGPQISANGTRQNSNSFQIDGVPVNSLAWGGAAVITPNEESVKEIKVVASSYSAENGRNSGAQVYVVSQNGTNTPHGSFFFKAHRPGLNAFQRYNGPGGATRRDDARFNQFGGSVGGPVLKDRLFAFFSYETLRNSSSSAGEDWYETPQFLALGAPNSIANRILSFPGQGVAFNSILNTASAFNCGTVSLVEGTNCVTIPGQGLDVGSPLAAPLGTRDPGWVSNTSPGVGSGLDGIADIMRATTTGPNNATAQQFNGRLDFQATSKDLVAFSIYWVPNDRQFFNGPVRPANLWNNNALNRSATLLWTRTFTPSILNEARIGVSGWKWDEIESNPQEPWGLPSIDISSLGSIDVRNFGAPGPSKFNQLTYNIRDTLSYVRGGHSLKFGADIYREHANDEAPWGARPTYEFHNMWDFANDAPFRENGYFDPVTGQPTSARKDIRSMIYGFFAQDDWKLRSNLTLNFGLRWEYFTPITEKNDRLSNVVLGEGANTLTDLVIRQGGNLFETSKNNWGPQFGFNWSPTSVLGHDWQNKLVVRGGFGVGYNKLQEAITLNGRFNPPFLTELNLFDTDVLYAVPDDVNQFFNWPSNPVAIQTFDSATGLPTSGAPVTLQAFPETADTPVTYRYSLDTQYDLGANWVATIGYQGSQTRHYTRQRNLNVLYQNLNPRVRALQWFSNDANAHYNALLTQLTHRFSRQFEFDFQYRFAKNTDQGTQDYNIDQYPFDIVYSNGRADFDVRHNYKLWGVWTPTFFRGSNAWMEKILGNWTISGILNAHSGFPWSPVYDKYGCNLVYQGSGYCQLRPASYLGGAGNDYSNDAFMSPGGNFPGGGTLYFTEPTGPQGPAFPAVGPIPSAPGVGRNSQSGPHYFNIDMTLAKAFGLPRMPVLGENARIDFRANFYNIFNKLNLTNMEANIESSNFGMAKEGLGGRVIEMQARFSF
jgi:hypothetical protein